MQVSQVPLRVSSNCMQQIYSDMEARKTPILHAVGCSTDMWPHLGAKYMHTAGIAKLGACMRSN